MKKTGTREEVFSGTALHTSGKLFKADLIQNSSGVIVSKKQSESAVKRYPAMVEKLCRQHGHCEKVTVKTGLRSIKGSAIAEASSRYYSPTGTKFDLVMFFDKLDGMSPRQKEALYFGMKKTLEKSPKNKELRDAVEYLRDGEFWNIIRREEFDKFHKGVGL